MKNQKQEKIIEKSNESARGDYNTDRDDESGKFDGLLGTRGLIGQWSRQNFEEQDDSKDYIYEYT